MELEKKGREREGGRETDRQTDRQTSHLVVTEASRFQISVLFEW